MPDAVYNLVMSEKKFLGARPAAWGLSVTLHVVVFACAQVAINYLFY